MTTVSAIQKKKRADNSQLELVKKRWILSVQLAIEAAGDVEDTIDPKNENERFTLDVEGELKKPSLVISHLHEIVMDEIKSYEEWCEVKQKDKEDKEDKDDKADKDDKDDKDDEDDKDDADHKYKNVQFKQHN